MSRNLKRLTVLLIGILFLLCGCSKEKTIEEIAHLAQHSPAELYNYAANEIASSQSLKMEITTTTAHCVLGQTFTEKTSQTVQYRNYGTEHLVGSAERTFSYGADDIIVQELYADGNGYLTINEKQFLVPMAQEDYQSRFAPIVFFDTAQYETIQSRTINGRILVAFSQPTAAEAWALPDDARFIDSCGMAVFSLTGELLRCDYDITYIQGSATVVKSITASADASYVPAIRIPRDTDNHILLTDPDTPLLLEKACGFLVQAKHISSSTAEDVTCETFGVTRKQATTLTFDDTQQQLTAQIHTSVDQVNQSLGGTATEFSQTEWYQDGTYTVTSASGAPTTDTTVTKDDMLSYCHDLLVSSVMLPEYITGVTVAENTNLLRIQFTGSDALAEAICQKVCQILYNDPDLLNSMATAYKTNKLECYLEVSVLTGLPVASGIRFSGTHTIEGIPYKLVSDTAQTYTFME